MKSRDVIIRVFLPVSPITVIVEEGIETCPAGQIIRSPCQDDTRA